MDRHDVHDGDMTTDHIQLQIDGRIARVIIDRLKARNSISLAMAKAIGEAFAVADATPGVRVIALQGSGEWFSSGADLKELPESRKSPETAQAFDQQMSATVAQVAACRKPTIALLNGPVMGGGLAFTLACDMRIAAERFFIRVPVAQNGLFYAPVDAARLIALGGMGIAKWIMMSGETVDAEQALSWGLVTAVHPDDTFDEECTKLLQKLANAAPLSIEYTKQTLAEGPADTRLTNEAYARIYLSPDPMEAMAAIREKRAPVFRGDE